MNIRDEELLNRYFERQMSNGEEQNFLIDVAARDDMRVAFRSQLELLKAVRSDRDVMRGATFVRERTLSALGFAGVVLPVALAEDEAAAAPIATVASSGWRMLLQKPLVMLSGGLLVGALATFSVMNSGTEQLQQPAATVSTQTPKTEMLITTPTEAPIQNTVQTEAAQPKVKSTAHKTVVNAPVQASTVKETNANLPVVNRSETPTIITKPVKIVKPGSK